MPLLIDSTLWAVGGTPEYIYNYNILYTAIAWKVLSYNAILIFTFTSKWLCFDNFFSHYIVYSNQS